MYLVDETELQRIKQFVLDGYTHNEQIQARIAELQGNHLHLQGNILAISTTIGQMLRKLDDIHREYKSQLSSYEKKLGVDLKKRQDTYHEAKVATELLSNKISVVNELAMMNKNQMELLAKDFNNHSCYRNQQTMDITQSFSTSCSISPLTSKAISAVDKNITNTVQDIASSRRHKTHMKRLQRPKL